MWVKLEPTPEIFEAVVNGATVPLRIWAGQTGGGVPIEAYILSITPNDPADSPTLKAELPLFMGPSRQAFAIGDYQKQAPDA